MSQKRINLFILNPVLDVTVLSKTLKHTHSCRGKYCTYEVLNLITIKILQKWTYTPTVPVAFGKDLRWITAEPDRRDIMLFSGQLCISAPILWLILKYELLSERIIIFMCNYQLCLTSHPKTAFMWTSQRGLSERSGDTCALQRIWCSGLFWGSTISM